ncbi:c-type cytochrome [Pseudomonas aeruginosa]|nr:c-type cytochrome [Pseudomonas aeruginosa]
MKQLGFLLALGLCAISGTAAAACDAAAGQKLFESKCTACHSLAEHKVGPRLHDVYGRKVGTAQGFGYTPTLEQAGFTWNAEKLDAFLSGPMNFLPGTAMAFGGLRKQDDRQTSSASSNSRTGASHEHHSLHSPQERADCRSGPAAGFRPQPDLPVDGIGAG